MADEQDLLDNIPGWVILLGFLCGILGPPVCAVWVLVYTITN